MARQIRKEKQNLVLGRVVDKGDRPLVNLIVQAFDRDMRSEKLLGESITDKNGKYEITWLHSQLSGRGKGEADISLMLLPLGSTCGITNSWQDPLLLLSAK